MFFRRPKCQVCGRSDGRLLWWDAKGEECDTQKSRYFPDGPYHGACRETLLHPAPPSEDPVLTGPWTYRGRCPACDRWIYVSTPDPPPELTHCGASRRLLGVISRREEEGAAPQAATEPDREPDAFEIELARELAADQPVASEPSSQSSRVHAASEPSFNDQITNPALRARHLYVIGKSGAGKTTLLKKLFLEDMRRGNGATFIDPHGDAVDALLGLVPDDRLDDVIYFNPVRPDAPAFNLLGLPFPPAKLTDDIVSAFKMLSDSWGPQLEHILANAVTTLLTDREPHSFADLRTLLTVAAYRDAVVGRIQNAQLRAFWEHEWPLLPKGAANPILNRLSAFLRPTSDLERVFSSTENAIDFSRILNEGRLLLVNLSKGMLGEESARFLGALLATAMQQAALARAVLPEHERRPHYFYVDEFQNYTTASFETVLSEARKYRLSLTLANQTLAQLPPRLESAIFGNVATLIAFQVSATDATTLVREMHATTQRTLCRQRGQKEIQELASALPQLRAHYEKEYAQWVERRDYYATSDADTPGVRHYKDAQREVDRLAPIVTVLRTDGPSLAQLRDTLSRDCEFWEETVTIPTPDDLLNLTPLNAWIRLERVDRVFRLDVKPPPSPDPARSERILERQRRAYEASGRPAASTDETAAPAEELPLLEKRDTLPAIKSPKPVTEDDFTF